jgi:hypothetical protein
MDKYRAIMSEPKGATETADKMQWIIANDIADETANRPLSRKARAREESARLQACAAEARKFEPPNEALEAELDRRATAKSDEL